MKKPRKSLCGLPDCLPKCKACSKIRSAAYYAANKERVTARIGAWRSANAERFKEQQASYRANNSEKRRAGRIKYNKENAERIKAAKATYHLLNRERKSQVSADYYLRNKDRIAERVRKWQANNKDVMKAIVQNRRARLKQSAGRLSSDIEQRLYVLQRGRCACCRRPLGENYHLDHIMPLTKGGRNIDSNIQLLRAQCNLQKSTKDPIVYMQLKGYLL